MKHGYFHHKDESLLDAYYTRISYVGFSINLVLCVSISPLSFRAISTYEGNDKNPTSKLLRSPNNKKKNE